MLDSGEEGVDQLGRGEEDQVVSEDLESTSKRGVNP